jgi:hypothetical protein
MQEEFMEPTHGNNPRRPPSGLSDGRDRTIVAVAALAERSGIRIMRGGGTVFTRHGLISPTISRFVALVVDPDRVGELIGLLEYDGWTVVPASSNQILPPTVVKLRRDGFEGTLNLYGLIAGFFAEPTAVFDGLWALRNEVTGGEVAVPILGKLPTVMFAAHHRLDGHRWTGAAQMHFGYFLSQFQGLLSQSERDTLAKLANEYGARDELRRMLLGLGLEVGPTVVPSVGYVRRRLGLERVTDADTWVVTAVEMPRGRRAAFPGAAAASAALFRLLGARKRLGV